MRKPGGKTGQRRVPRGIFPKKYHDLCVAWILCQNLAEAAAEVKLAPAQATAVLARPDAQQHIKNLQEQAFYKDFQNALKDYSVSRNFLDRQTVRLATKAKSEAIQLRAVRTGYETLGLVNRPDANTTNNNNSAGAIASQGNNAFQVYEAAWLTRRKMGWDKILEEKHQKTIEAPK